MNLIYNMQEAFEAGVKLHPQKQMESLGFKYEDASPQPIFDAWIFYGVESTRDEGNLELPVYLRVYEGME